MHHTPSLFDVINSAAIAQKIAKASKRVILVAPGMQASVAEALIHFASSSVTKEIVVSLDLDERVFRMGYGDFASVEKLQAAGIPFTSSPGLRTALLIVDDAGWIFTPIAQLLEGEPHSSETPNAIRLLPDQLDEILLRVSPAKRQEVASANPSTVIPPPEIGTAPVTRESTQKVGEQLEIAPPVAFDVARQVQVFIPYLQYIELSMKGAKLQSRRVRIPKSLQSLGVSRDLEDKLNTTLDLIGKGESLSSKHLEDELNKIRNDFTRSLGDNQRVVLKKAKRRLDERLNQLKAKLESHQQKVEAELHAALEKSLQDAVTYFLPIALKNPPDELTGSVINVDEAAVRKWVTLELRKVFPVAEDLIEEMKLQVTFKDVTYETLNAADFLKALKKAYPDVDWEKPYRDFKAAGEKVKP